MMAEDPTFSFAALSALVTSAWTDWREVSGRAGEPGRGHVHGARWTQQCPWPVTFCGLVSGGGKLKLRVYLHCGLDAGHELGAYVWAWRQGGRVRGNMVGVPGVPAGVLYARRTAATRATWAKRPKDRRELFIATATRNGEARRAGARHTHGRPARDAQTSVSHTVRCRTSHWRPSPSRAQRPPSDCSALVLRSAELLVKRQSDR